MTDRGDFAAHRRDGDHVTKTLDEQHPAGAHFVAAAQNVGVTGMHRYLRTLRAAGVTLPPELSVVSAEPLAVRHRWVTGSTLLDCAHTDSARFIDGVVEIARWVRALDRTDARLDTNLANFCLADEHVVLVDVLPPLIPSVCPQPSNLFEILFSALCFNTMVILDALIGYATRALLQASASVAPGERDALARQVSADAAEASAAVFPASWFRARVVLGLRALAGDIASQVVQEFFALTSVRVFRDLPETARADRIRQVGQALKELALA
jgi:hypothetical protein